MRKTLLLVWEKFRGFESNYMCLGDCVVLKPKVWLSSDHHWLSLTGLGIKMCAYYRRIPVNMVFLGGLFYCMAQTSGIFFQTLYLSE